MFINDIRPPDGSPRRLLYVHASSLLVVQALSEAHQRLARHLPALSWSTWGDLLQQ